jgi:hypothetical protein
MNSSEIEKYLQALGDELATRGVQKPVRVMVVGGVFMLINIRNRRATADVDIVLMDIESMSYLPLSDRAKQFRAAVWAVAKKMKLPRNWMNDDSSLFVTSFLSDTDARLWKRFNKLEVFFPSKEAVFAMKIIAFRDKDQGDIEALCKQLRVFTRAQAQAIMDRYVTEVGQRENLVARTLDRLFD